MTSRTIVSRRLFLLGAGATVASIPFSQEARALSGLSEILASASDNALTKLAQPDAFYDDENIRIKMPFIGDAGGGLGNLASKASGLLGGNKNLDIFSGITRKMNDVASIAAGEAKPIFRDSIGKLSLNDAPGIIKQEDGATQYLRTTSADTLQGKIRPFVDDSMNDIGVYDELSKLNRKSSLLKSAGITDDKLGSSVTEQALNGMFAYIGVEEANFRSNPVGKASNLVKGFLK